MELINKRENRSIVLHIIAGTILVAISAIGSYAAAHTGNIAQQQVSVNITQQ